MAIEIRTFGLTEVSGLAEAEAASLLARPKRLALLVYLAVEGAAPREALASLFWPDSRRERGRGALRNTILFLRRHVGAAALGSRSDVLVLDERLVRCDAVTFRDRVAERRFEDAAELHRGAFLRGLRVTGAPGLRTWIERQRAELAREASEVHWALADRAEALGNWISASDHARRAVDLSESPESALRRLMQLLDRAGDRVAAVREYEAFATRWEREFDLQPSPQTLALVKSLRNEKARGEGSYSPPLAGRDPLRRYKRIAVLPLLLPGSEPEHRHLASGFAQEVVDTLCRLRMVQVIGRASAGRYGTGDPGVVRRAARELEVDAVVDGSLTASGEGLAVVVRLFDAGTGTTVWADVDECDAPGTLELRSRLLRRLLEALELGLPAPELEEITRGPTTDAAAFDAYLRGRWCLGHRSQRDLEAAVRQFELALSIDGELALALAGIAQAQLLLYMAAGVRWSEVRVRARDAARAALAVDPNLGQVRAVLGMVKALELDFEGAEDELRRATELSPGHATAHHWYGALLSFVGGRFDEGARTLEIARQLDPFSPIIRNDIGLATLHRGRVGDAIARLRESVEMESRFWRSHLDLGIAYFVAGDREAGARHLRRAWALGAFGAADEEPDAPARARDWRGTLEEKLRELEASTLHRGTRGFEAALLCVLLGRSEEALSWLSVVQDERSWLLVGQYYPAFATLEGNAVFDDYVREVGLRAHRS